VLPVGWLVRCTSVIETGLIQVSLVGGLVASMAANVKLLRRVKNMCKGTRHSGQNLHGVSKWIVWVMMGQVVGWYGDMGCKVGAVDQVLLYLSKRQARNLRDCQRAPEGRHSSDELFELFGQSNETIGNVVKFHEGGSNCHTKECCGYHCMYQVQGRRNGAINLMHCVMGYCCGYVVD